MLQFFYFPNVEKNLVGYFRIRHPQTHFESASRLWAPRPLLRRSLRPQGELYRTKVIELVHQLGAEPTCLYYVVLQQLQEDWAFLLSVRSPLCTDSIYCRQRRTRTSVDLLLLYSALVYLASSLSSLFENTLLCTRS